MTYDKWMNYQAAISETSDYLIRLERETKDLKARDRLRFIRFLKSGQAATQEEAGALIGIKVRQSQRLWKQYREGGVSAMRQNHYQGGQAKLTGEQKAQLLERLKEDQIQSLEQARQFLLTQFNVGYTLGGVSHLFKQLKVKLKTGRPTNIKQDAAQKEEFEKKNIQP